MINIILRNKFICVLLVVGLLCAMPIASADEGQSAQTGQIGQAGQAGQTENFISGSIASFDWVGQKITVDTLDEETTIFVPNDVSILRGTETIEQDDLQQGDDVEILYYQDPETGPTAIKIIDKNMANE